MKKLFGFGLVLFLALLAAPLSVYYSAYKPAAQTENAVDVPQEALQSTRQQEELPVRRSEEEILVCMASTDRVVELPLTEYVIGVVAGEMPALYEAEALKAQAAVSMNLARLALETGTKENRQGAHISSSSSVDQAYLTVEEMRSRWGDDFAVYYERIAQAVQAVEPYKIVHDGVLCMTAFHAVSPGCTENSENVWITPVDYLKAVNSDFDSTANNFCTTVRMDADTFAAGLEDFGFVPTQTARLWLGESVYSESGTLLSLAVGDITVTGSELRTVFGLRSAAVSVEYEDGDFVLTTYGYGHGVGMSQYGAQQLALQGKTWQEIIQHYYTGVQIVECEK